MRLITYLNDGKSRTGFLIHQQVVDLIDAAHAWQKKQLSKDRISKTHGFPFFDWLNALFAGESTWKMIREIHDYIASGEKYRTLESVQDYEEVFLLPPFQKPGKVICVGMNYPPSAEEAKGSKPPYPILFHKAATSLIGHRNPIVIPNISNQVEYEGELAVVIGKRGKNISREFTLDWIAGYTIANDIGASDIQARSSQWTSGKMLDTFCPLGPTLVSRDEIFNPDNLRIRTQLNDETVQDDTTDEMYFSIAELVSYISTLTTLEPGDIILTGSPKSVGGRPDPRHPLNPGDTIRVEIEKLGVLTNPIIAEEL